MTKKEIAEHRLYVTVREVDDFMEVTFTLENTLVNTESKVKVRRYFRSNIPIAYVEHLINKHAKNGSQPTESVFPSNWVYRGDLKIVRYLDEKSLPKDPVFLNEYEKNSRKN
jgi:hypothetical protein